MGEGLDHRPCGGPIPEVCGRARGHVSDTTNVVLTRRGGAIRCRASRSRTVGCPRSRHNGAWSGIMGIGIGIFGAAHALLVRAGASALMLRLFMQSN